MTILTHLFAAIGGALGLAAWLMLSSHDRAVPPSRGDIRWDV